MMNTYYEDDDDFKAWHLAKFAKPKEGVRVLVYFSYRFSNRQRYIASSYGYATWTPYIGWKIEDFPGSNAKVISWQYPKDVDWDNMLHNYGLISDQEYKRRMIGGDSSWVK